MIRVKIIGFEARLHGAVEQQTFVQQGGSALRSRFNAPFGQSVEQFLQQTGRRPIISQRSNGRLGDDGRYGCRRRGLFLFPERHWWRQYCHRLPVLLFDDLHYFQQGIADPRPGEVNIALGNDAQTPMAVVFAEFPLVLQTFVVQVIVPATQVFGGGLEAFFQITPAQHVVNVIRDAVRDLAYLVYGVKLSFSPS